MSLNILVDQTALGPPSHHISANTFVKTYQKENSIGTLQPLPGGYAPQLRY